MIVVPRARVARGLPAAEDPLHVPDLRRALTNAGSSRRQDEVTEFSERGFRPMHRLCDLLAMPVPAAGGSSRWAFSSSLWRSSVAAGVKPASLGWLTIPVRRARLRLISCPGIRRRRSRASPARFAARGASRKSNARLDRMGPGVRLSLTGSPRSSQINGGPHAKVARRGCARATGGKPVDGGWLRDDAAGVLISVVRGMRVRSNPVPPASTAYAGANEEPLQAS
jgi:hypothetical protein